MLLHPTVFLMYLDTWGQQVLKNVSSRGEQLSVLTCEDRSNQSPPPPRQLDPSGSLNYDKLHPHENQPRRHLCR